MTPEERATLADAAAAAWVLLDGPTRDRVRWASLRLGDALDALAGLEGQPGLEAEPGLAAEPVRDRLARYARGLPSFTCPRCLRPSFNPADVATGYCGACHDFTAPQGAT